MASVVCFVKSCAIHPGGASTHGGSQAGASLCQGTPARIIHTCGALFVGLSLFAGAAAAQQLTYAPVNPQFGGNPFNSTQLEADAAAQKPTASVASSTQSQAQLFAQELQSELYADLATQVSNAIFGPNAQNSGTFSFAGETVTFNKSLTETTINIDANGTTTTITLPNSESSASAVGVN